MEDVPLAACVAGGSVTYIRKVPSELEQSALVGEEEARAACGSQAAAAELPCSQEHAAEEGDSCQPADGRADDQCAAAAPLSDMQRGSMPDDVDCLEVEAC